MNEIRALQLSPCRTVVTSFNPRQTPAIPSSGAGRNNNHNGMDDYYEEGDWVLCVHSSTSFISCALSNGELQVYDPRRLHVACSIPKLHGPDGMVTDLVGAPPQQQADHILVSSGSDGRVCVMDLRQQQKSPRQLATSFSLPHSHEEALSISLGYDGNLAAVGSNKAKIHFFDLRQPHQPLGSYVNSHTDEVTRVRFQQFPHYFSSSTANTASSGSLLLTGSEDGLACIFDTTQPSEEAALKSVMNAQTSLREVGFFGPNLEGVFCMTGSETLSLWAWDSATCLGDYHDIRTRLGGVNYLVNAHWDHGRSQLSIMSGYSNGDACLSILNTSSNFNNNVATPGSGGTPSLTTTHCLAGGHRAVVRDWCPLSASQFVTVGEDARLCEWNLTGRQAYAISSKTVATTPTTQFTIRRGSDPSRSNALQQPSAGRGGPIRRQRNKRIAAPY